MVQKLRTFVLTLIAGAALVMPIAIPSVVFAGTDQINGSLNCGADLNIDAAGNACASDPESGAKLNSMITLAINIFSLIVGIISVIMIIIGGLKYVTSGGDSGNITGAKNTILYAIIGLVVVALAQFIVHFVLNKTQTSIQ